MSAGVPIEDNERFPDYNPNPVMQVTTTGILIYANAASEPVLRELAIEVGRQLPTGELERLREAMVARREVELVCGHRTFELLPVALPELGLMNVYGTDVTGARVVERFPNQNPNPVFRVDDEGRLVYANDASQPLISGYGLKVGDAWPTEIAQRLLAAADSDSGDLVELAADFRTYVLRPVRIPEFGFINVYGTDVTAEKVVAKFPGQNPNPVLRVDASGMLIYANEASAPMLASLSFSVGQPLPADLREQITARLASGTRQPIECVAGDQFFELVAVEIPEFGFINLYGTDVTAARQVAAAREESERLLLNILPPPIADRLRRGERVIADRFDDASLLIADIVGFTKLSSELTPNALVKLLDDIFSVLDVLVERHGLEKVKTIGDAYMIVGGVPTASADHVERLAQMALDMSVAVHELQSDLPRAVEVRIGMSCGPLVAGVIGSKRTIYDVWGDTVNVASRMESLSTPGRIHVSDSVHSRLKDSFDFEPRGEIEVKGKGVMATYYLLGRRPASVSSPPGR